MSRRGTEADQAQASQLHQYVYDHLIALWGSAEFNARVLNMPAEEAEDVVTSAIGQFFVDRLYGQGAEMRDARKRIEDYWDVAEEADEERNRGERGERGGRDPDGRDERPERE